MILDGGLLFWATLYNDRRTWVTSTSIQLCCGSDMQ